jgi:cell filamentation protein
MLENKLGIDNQVELNKQEEIYSKKRALELFESQDLNELGKGTFK